MATLVQEHILSGGRGRAPVQVTYDSEVIDSFVRRDIAERLDQITEYRYELRYTVTGGRGDFVVRYGIGLSAEIDGTILPLISASVVDDLAEELILGSFMMRQWKIAVDFDGGSVSVDPRALHKRFGSRFCLRGYDSPAAA